MVQIQTVAFYINSLCWRYKQLLSKSTLSWWYMLEVQPALVVRKQVAFIHQLPTLEVQTVVLYINPQPGGTHSCFLN